MKFRCRHTQSLRFEKFGSQIFFPVILDIIQSKSILLIIYLLPLLIHFLQGRAAFPSLAWVITHRLPNLKIVVVFFHQARGFKGTEPLQAVLI